MSEDDDDVPANGPLERPILRTGRQTGGDDLLKKGAAAAALLIGGGALVQKGCEFGEGLKNGIGGYSEEAQNIAQDGVNARRVLKTPEIEPFDALKAKNERDQKNKPPER